MVFGRGAQGAIEYLLLLAAAIVVVSIVITFLSTTIQPAQDTGSVQTYEYLCKTLNSKTEDCACYLKTISYFKTGTMTDAQATTAGQTACCAKNIELLKTQWSCPTS